MKTAYGRRAHGWTPHAATRAPMPWVAEILGRHPTYGYQRQFITRKIDHPAARQPGADQGVWCWWTLNPGRLYQARYLTGPRGQWTTEWFTTTNDGDIRHLTEQEVEQWLNDHSTSTS